MNELYDVMRTTFAVREFTDDPVPDPVLYRILDNARFAPSGGNRQGWRVIVVTDRQLRRRMRELYEQPWNDYMVTTGGRAALTSSLFRIATLLTPNVPEVAALLGEPLAVDEADAIRQGERLLGFGSQAILLKGGHPYASGRYAGHADTEDAVDLLISRSPADWRSAGAGAQPARGR